jgi:TonB family protein
MNRLEKKCLVASAGMHLFLFLLVVFGSAFFVSRDKTPSLPPLRAVPTRLVDDALSGGGGNPNIAPSDAQQKGQTLVPQPRIEPQPLPKPEVKRTEPKREVEKVEKPKPTKPVKESVKEVVKPLPDPTKASQTAPIVLKPITRSTMDKSKEQAEKEAREAAAAAAAARSRVAQAFAKANERLKEGFSQGTKVDVSGPGGEAYADYTQFVKSVYDDAWIVTDALIDEDSTAKVSVTIGKSGRVISAHIERRSGDSALDRSVQRALDKVKFVAPFPAGATDDQRTFLINFNLKSKRSLG